MKKSDGDKVLKIGKENSTFQHLETLRRNRQKRHRSGEFVVEGVRSINNAISADWEIRGVIYAKTGRLSAWAEDVLVTCDSAIRYEL
ncbi:hypothetical protein KKF05_02840, partial [Patescibacteria group bacterium]|nr:hypothetical protein [Patescibacteria group bacterium]